MAGKVILCLNRGSSTQKFALYQVTGQGEALVAEGAVERVGPSNARMQIRNGEKKTLFAEADFAYPKAPLQKLLPVLEELKLPAPDAAGHRLVHGGREHFAPERITTLLISKLKRLIPFAPLHLREEIRGIEETLTHYPGLPQVACFDTAFHHAMPELAQRFPLPRVLWDQGLRRYGFHGISYEYIMQTLGSEAPSRIVIAHLGNGASMVAVRDRHPLETTMGFSPTGGFMMGTRSGDLDPGAILYLLNEQHLDATLLERLVNNQSGLLGVSGLSSDMAILLEQSAQVPQAAQAVEMFCYHVRKQIGALTAVLGGLDLLVFTGGIGEHASPVRWEICRGLEYLGITLDREQNEANADFLSLRDSRVLVRVIPTDEDLIIARHTYRIVFASHDETAAS
jgi:acetate kinase